MTLDELALEVNRRGNYAKEGGSPMGAGQIHLRTRSGGSYDHLFERVAARSRHHRRQGAEWRPLYPAGMEGAVVGTKPILVPGLDCTGTAALAGPGRAFSWAEDVRTPSTPRYRGG